VGDRGRGGPGIDVITEVADDRPLEQSRGRIYRDSAKYLCSGTSARDTKLRMHPQRPLGLTDIGDVNNNTVCSLHGKNGLGERNYQIGEVRPLRLEGLLRQVKIALLPADHITVRSKQLLFNVYAPTHGLRP